MVSAVGLDFLGRRVHVGDPVECLLRRRDVIAHRREHDDRLLDRLQVEIASGTQPRFAGRQLVADEEIVDDPADLLLVVRVEAAPPAFELEEAFRLGVDVLEQVVPLVPQRVRRVQVFEVGNEVGAVEFTRAQVRRKQRQPRAAQQAAHVAHRRIAVVARPVRHRCAVDDERACDIRPRGREHHYRPPALAVADDHRLLAARMALGDDADELGFGVRDVGKRLAGTRIGEEDHEVHRMAGGKRDTDLRVFLRAADARAVARARIDDHEGPLGVVDDDPLGRNDPHQRMIRGPRIVARVGDHLVFVGEHRRLACRFVLEPLVAALAQRVPVERRALCEVDVVFGPLPPEFGRRLGRRASFLPGGARLAQAFAEALVRGTRPALENVGDRSRDAD